MKLLIISKNETEKGFSLIEILITVLIIVIILTTSSFANLNDLSQDSFLNEYSTLFTLLQRTRNRAINNIEHEKFGLHIGSEAFIIFRGENFVSEENTNEKILRNKNIIITTLPLSFENIVFDQLSGNPDNLGSIILSDGSRIKIIKIKNGGLIE